MKQSKFNESKGKSQAMQHIERLSEKLQGSEFSDEKLSTVEESISYLQNYLKVSRIQALLFTAILALNFKKRRVSIDHLSGFFKCTGIQIIKYLPDLKELQKNRWIRSDQDGENKRSMLTDINYYVVREVFDRIMDVEHETIKSPHKKDVYRLLSDLMETAEDYNRDRISYEEMMDETRELVGIYEELPYLKLLNSIGLNEGEKLLFMLLCQRTLIGNDELDLESIIGMVSASSYDGIHLKRSIIRKTSKLITREMIKLQDGMFHNAYEILLTEHAVRTFFPNDSDILIKHNNNTSSMVRKENIIPMKLFFNVHEKQHLDRLNKLLSKTGYKGVVRRLKAQHMRSGFTVMLHGDPGTGKTEAVHQLALRTGREVMRVDMSKTKSKWFGESEKKVAEIFKQYRQLLKTSEVTPILLFNEADGVFSRRVTNFDTNSAQTANTMQNILLEELENFEGILIATTNLTTNFDAAFERRFLYKIEFSKPDELTRQKIWRSKIAGLKPAVASRLSGEFDFSGGQIENVTRKFMIDSVLHQVDANYETLAAYCREEKFCKSVHTQLGYRRNPDKKAS